jgi:hypothetical protein
MALWRVDVYADQNGTVPIHSGYTVADTMEQAADVATRAMKDHPRADLIKVTARSVPSIPTDKVLWE